MLSSALVEGALGSRLSGGSLSCTLTLLQRSVTQQQAAQQSCRDLSSLTSPTLPGREEAAAGPAQAGCSSSSTGSDVAGRVSLLGGLQHQVLTVLQRRGISSSASSSYEFKSHLTRYAKSKVANRDNFQRWRDSGRDVRVAQDILREGGGRRDGRGGAGEGRSAMAELKSLLDDCRDLQELQVVLRECGRDMRGPLLCAATSRLHRLKQATPAAAAPAALARRIAETLMPLVTERVSDCSISNLAAALSGLAECGVLPGRPLIEAVTSRVLARSPRGGSALIEADPRVLSALMGATCRVMTLQRQQQQRQPAADGGDVVAEQLWPALLAAAEAKLLRALGEEPPSAPAAPAGGEDGPEVDDSIPQFVLRTICKSLTLAHEQHSGVWTAAARLSARHAGELQPDVAAAVLRSYAYAGGPALDGGREGLLDAVWAALGPQVKDLSAEVLQDLLLAAAKLAVAPGAPVGAADGQAAAARQMLRPICDALVPRLPSLTCGSATSIATCLAKAHGSLAPPTAAAQAVDGAVAAPAPPAVDAEQLYGKLPRLMADLLLLRGPAKFGAREFASVALALGLLGHADAAFWDRVAAAALPELPRMDGGGVSRLLGAFQHASGAAKASANAAAPLLPPAEFVAAAHARLAALLESGASGIGARDAFYALRCLADLPLPEGGAAALSRLADRLVEADASGEPGFGLAAAQPANLERWAQSLRAAGLGEHPVMRLFEAGRQ